MLIDQKLENLLHENVTVYFNLHKRLWSVKHKGKVVGHVKHITIIPSKFHVNEEHRQQVIANKCRKVHAWINGKLLSYGNFSQIPDLGLPISFNPYRSGSFYWQFPCGDHKPIDPNEIEYLYFNGNTKKCYSLSTFQTTMRGA